MPTYTVEFFTMPAGDTHAVPLQPADSVTDAIARVHYAYGAAIARHDTGGTTAYYRVCATGDSEWHYHTAAGAPHRVRISTGWDGND